MDYQQPHGYQRPPPLPPPAADPYQRPPPPVPPPPANHPWSYSATQFQYQPQTQHSPSPPPPQWPVPHSSDHAQYPAPPPAYPPHQPQLYPANPHYPPPHSLPPRPPHLPQSYSQDWASGSWSHHQSWQYPTNNNEEDWAAKARAWAAAKSATDNLRGLSQFVPAGRPEEQSQFRDQYSQSIDPQFHDGNTVLAPASNYQQYAVSVGYPGKACLGDLQDPHYISSGVSSYPVDMRAPFAARDGSLTGDSVAPFPQEKSSMSSLVHRQEVSSSYSSAAGNEEAGDGHKNISSSVSLPVASLSQHHVQQLLPSGDRFGRMEEPHNLLSSQPDEFVTDLSNQPLNFAPHFNRNMDPHLQPNLTHSSGGLVRAGDPAISSNYAWAPSSAPGAVYPPVPPTIPSGTQVDQPIVMPSPAPGHSAPMFPTGPGFQPTVPMIGGAAFGVGGAGVTPPPTAFPGDTYGASERPKKASVPNWLREEIIKKKAVITSSAPGITKEDSQSIEEDGNDKSLRKGDQADSKSIDSSRSTEDEDGDEVEAARTAAINQEIKRVLTEVLLKVTDELFDEIATKVLNEDDLSVEVGHDVDLEDHHTLPSTPSVLTPKASAKVLIPTKDKENDFEDASEKLISGSSGSPGDILGLASYASDEDDEEILSSDKLISKDGSNVLEGNPVVENGGPQEDTEQGDVPAKLDTETMVEDSPVTTVRELASIDDQNSSKRLSSIAEDELKLGSDNSKANDSLFEKVDERYGRPDGNSDARRLTSDDSQIQSTGNRSNKSNHLENKKILVKKDRRDSESSKERLDKGDEEHKRHEDKRARSERIEYQDTSKDKGKEKGRTDEKVKSIESKKQPSLSTGKEGTTGTRRDKRTSGEKDSDEKRQDRTGYEKKEQSRHKTGSESGRHKQYHSSSVGVRGRESKDHSVVSRANDSSEESSDQSTRKSRHSRRQKSPSPIRSRKRQVSRSPHSKHSKRRHSPYSSLETSRGKRSPSRSRSRSPLRRR